MIQRPLSAVLVAAVLVAGLVALDPAAPPTSAVGLLPGSPVAEWRLDAKTGTASPDATGNGHAGVVSGGATWSAGRINGGLALGGVDGQLAVSDAAGLDGMAELTVSAWVRVDSLPGLNYDIAGKNGSGGNSYRLALDASGHPSFAVRTTSNAWYSTGSVVTAPVALGVGTWHHLLGVYDGGRVRLFLDGNPVGDGPDVLSGPIYDSVGPFRLGAATGSSVEPFHGAVDEVRLYDAALGELDAVNLHRSYTVEWNPAEIALTAADDYADPYRDVVLDATFVGPDDETVTVPGFWDGDVWRLRFAPPAAGEWTYETSASPADPSLHGRTGTVIAGVYQGAEQISSRGFLHREAGERHLSYRDGSPFFWMAETHTFGLVRESWSSSNDSAVDSQFRDMVDAADRDGFTVYQTGLFVGELGDAAGTGTANEGGYAWGSPGLVVSSSSASDSAGYYQTVNKAVDGRIETAWMPTASDAAPWIIVDLGEQTALSSVTTRFPSSSSWRYRVEGSTDGASFHALADRSAGVAGRTIVDAVSGTVRYVRLAILGAGTGVALGVDEFTIEDSTGTTLDNSHKWDRPNPEFWRDIDRRVAYIAERGLVTALTFDWGRDLEPSSVEEHQRIARYIVARLGAYPMVWAVAGEYGHGDDASWGEVAEYTRAVDPHDQPVTLLNTDANAELFRGEPWYDLVLLQGAHDARREISHWLTPYQASPTLPVLEGEIDFESILGIPSYYTREDAYRSVMAGSFGFSYGAEGVWNAVRDAQDSFQMWGSMPRPWYDARDFPVRQQMRYFADFFTGIPWQTLEPSTGAVSWGATAPTAGIRRPFQKAAPDGSLVVAYLPSQGSPVTGTVNGLVPGATYRAHWYDTRSGTLSPIGSAFVPGIGGTWAVPAQPDPAYDWVLLVERTDGRAARVVISPAGGSSSSAPSVTLTTATPGATIRFTTDGTAPTAQSSVYTAPITVDTSTVVRAAAFATGLGASNASTAYFVVSGGPVAAPVATVERGTYPVAQSVAFSTATPGAQIFYTVDGTRPSTATTAYTGPVTVDRSQVVRAVAVTPDGRSSAIVAHEYRILSRDLVSMWMPVAASSGSGASALVDGDVATTWSPAGTAGEWAVVDLARLHEISRVELRFRAAGGYFYRVQTSADGVTYTTVADLSTTRTNALGVEHAHDFAPVIARYVRYQLVAVYAARAGARTELGELRVFGATASLARELARGSEANIAFGAPIRTSSTFANATSTGRLAGDNNTTTSWQAASGSTANQWIEVDFGESRSFNSARIMEFGNRTTQYRIEVWAGGAWQTAYSGTTIGTANQFSTVRFPPVTGTRARLLIVTASAQPIIYEFQLFDRVDRTSASSNFDEGSASRFAFDGNPATSWQASAGSYAGQWLERDLGTMTAFDSAEILERGNRTSGYRIEYWDGSAWQAAFTGTTIGDQRTVGFPEVTGSRVRLMFTSGLGQPMIHEFTVMNRTHTASSSAGPTAGPERAFDGLAGTAWEAAAGTGFAGSWVEVDFGTFTTFTGVTLREHVARTSEYRIEYWDGSGWQAAHTGTTIGAESVVQFPAVTATRVRLLFLAGSAQPAIAEFEPHARTGILSAGGSATASSHSNVNHTATKAVDGDPATYWSASGGTFPQSLVVDLGSLRTVTSVTQTFSNSTAWRYRIEVSSDGSSYVPWTDQSAVGLTGTSFYHPGRASARYVRLTVVGSGTGDWATSTEFVVHGY